MRYTPLSASFYRSNREAFIKKMKPSSIAIFNSNDIYPISADSILPFTQHRDIFYLSGIDQEKSILVLFPDAIKSHFKEVLFLKRTNAHIARWEGSKLTKQKAADISGIETIYWLEDFESILHRLTSQCDTIYYNTNEHYRQSVETETREDRFIRYCKSKYPAHGVARSNPILQRLRSIKHQEEINQIQKACNITERGFRRVLPMIQPGVWEYEIEAEFIHEFIRSRSKGSAYSPIIASGENALVLHYITNNRKCQSGDLVLMDIGAEYGNYSSDMTRTVPISGKFSSRQKAVYNSVLNVKNEATKLLVPGTYWEQYHQQVGELMTEELLSLGLIKIEEVQNQSKDFPAYKKFFMHGTSHHLGLDTHDYGLLHEPMEANMVFTVEPGIYIPEEGLGIRLEDDVVIQSEGEPLNLMNRIPIQIEEIEDLMSKQL